MRSPISVLGDAQIMQSSLNKTPLFREIETKLKINLVRQKDPLNRQSSLKMQVLSDCIVDAMREIVNLDLGSIPGENDNNCIGMVNFTT